MATSNATDVVLLTTRQGTFEDPFRHYDINLKICNNILFLPERPDKKTHLVVDGYYEVYKTPIASNQFICNYSNGIVTFNESENGKKVTVHFDGTGFIQIPANMVYVHVDGDPDMIQSFQELVDGQQLAIEATANFNAVRGQFLQKDVYDIDDDGIVDNAENAINAQNAQKLENQSLSDLDGRFASLSKFNAHLLDSPIYIMNPPTPLVACKCDGTTDDSTTFQNIVNFVSAAGGGEIRLPRSPQNPMMLRQEIDIPSNVTIKGYGWASRVFTDVGSSGNGLNLFKAFEKSNILLKNFRIENMGYGKSGVWTPAGTFDGIGACILIVGCDNVITEGVYALKDPRVGITGQSIGNIYYSCCTNSKIINNYVSQCANGIVVDAWYNQATSKARFVNDGVVISGNTVTKGVGRGICIENINTPEYTFTDDAARDAYFTSNPSLLVHGVTVKSNSKLQKYFTTAVPSFWKEYKPYGSISVTGNTITKMAYAGIQGNNIFNCTITGNSIDGNEWDRDGYGNVHYFTWYGMEFVAGSKDAVIANNTIQNIKYNGIRCFEATNLTVKGNTVLNCEDFAIFVKNLNDPMYNVDVSDNIVDTQNAGIFVGRDSSSSVDMYSNKVNGNIVQYNTVGASYGIQFENHTLSKCDENILYPVQSFGGNIGIKANNSLKNSFNHNTLQNLTRAIDLTNDTQSVSYGNQIENCVNGYRLDNATRTIIDSKFRSVTTAFDVVNGKTTASTRCRALNSDFDGVTNIKNGTGITVWFTGSAAPGSGTWENGDRVRNDAPTVSSYSEWLYAAGAWKPIGLIT